MKVSIGQDSHRFDEVRGAEGCLLGGVRFAGVPPFLANSDGDVVLHAVTNAVSGITGRNILGPVADKMCREGIRDSREYLAVALEDLRRQGYRTCHLSVSIEGSRPKITPQVESMKRSLGALLQVPPEAIGITATTGEGLTDFGRELGVSVFCVLTVEALPEDALRVE